MKNLKLVRPIVFIDLETTGLSPTWDRIVELTALKVFPDGSEELKSTRINPEMPIPEEVTAIHGITDSDVSDKPKFRQYARSLVEFFDNCDIGGFNVKKFDLPLLESEFKRAGVEFSREGRRILDSQVIYHQMEPRNLAAAYLRYCGKELENSHSSQSDVRAAYEIMDAQLETYPELSRDTDELHDLCNLRDPTWIDQDGKFVWSGDGAAFGFGQYKGKLLVDIARHDPDYLEWMVGDNFSSEVNQIAEQAMDGMFPERPSRLQ